jgi:hypothetical protein
MPGRLRRNAQPLLPERDSALIEPHNVERVFADIDADHAERSIVFLRH